jgi:hypothetical protein
MNLSCLANRIALSAEAITVLDHSFLQLRVAIRLLVEQLTRHNIGVALLALSSRYATVAELRQGLVRFLSVIMARS